MSTRDGRHWCSEQLPFDGPGEAIDSCNEDAAGVFWVGNSEYGSAVRFCPFCGLRAPTDPTTIGRTPFLRAAKPAAENR